MCANYLFLGIRGRFLIRVERKDVVYVVGRDLKGKVVCLCE